MTTTRLLMLLLHLWAIAPASALFGLSNPWKSTNNQQPFLLTSSSPSSNYSVGFSLASSYGAAAVIIDEPNGDKKTLTWTVNGSSEYQSVMTKLSLTTSQHLAPPYDDMQQYFDDIPRVTARRLKKQAGLPSTPDVGILSTVIQSLVSKIEHDLPLTVTSATLSAPHLEALYQDDIQDICAYTAIQYIVPKALYKPLLWETSAAYAGYGFGLCEHWRDDERCQEENNEFEFTQVLAVHYSRNALTTSLATIRSAIGANEPSSGRLEQFDLGRDAKGGFGDEEVYWGEVRGAVVQRMEETPGMGKPVRIILTGDAVDDEFVGELGRAMKGVMKDMPPVFGDDALVAAAKGAAEFRRRGQSPFQ